MNCKNCNVEIEEIGYKDGKGYRHKYRPRGMTIMSPTGCLQPEPKEVE